MKRLIISLLALFGLTLATAICGCSSNPLGPDDCTCSDGGNSDISYSPPRMILDPDPGPTNPPPPPPPDSDPPPPPDG